jgi:hypothetical protein
VTANDTVTVTNKPSGTFATIIPVHGVCEYRCINMKRAFVMMWSHTNHKYEIFNPFTINHHGDDKENDAQCQRNCTYHFDLCLEAVR